MFHGALSSAMQIAAHAVVNSVGKDLRLAVPMSIGKPILILDALYRLAEADRRVQLTIFTGLTLTLPRPRSSLECRRRPRHPRLADLPGPQEHPAHGRYTVLAPAINGPGLRGPASAA